MAATITKNILNLRELFSKVDALFATANKPTLVEKVFTGNGSTTAFVLPAGFKPYAVYVNGTRLLAAGISSTTYDTNICTVTLAAAPSAVANNVQIDMVRI